MAPDPARRTRWPDLFHQSARPIFVLNKSRRLRFANAAWEKLTGRTLADAAGSACVRKGPTEPLFRTLAPPAGLAAGKVATARRPAPGAKAGPPWWDVTFVSLAGDAGPAGFLGLIEVVAPTAPPAPRKVSPAVAALREAFAARFTPALFAGDGPTAERFESQIRLASSSTVPAWIVGEPGTGKETLARAIHRAGPTRERAFVGLDCGGLQPYLIESLLFGTGGPAARLGTVYLKDPAALPRDVQQKFADWLTHDGPRAICGATTPAAEGVRAGRLVPDFEAQLATLELRIPPLRERPTDISRLVAALGFTVPDDALAMLRTHSWPGNVRELRDVLHAAAAEGAVAVERLPRYIRERALPPGPRPEPKLNLDAVLAAVEKRLIEVALKDAGGNQTDAAAKLGIFRTRLGRRIEALGIDNGERRA